MPGTTAARSPLVDVAGLRAELGSASPPVLLDVRWSLTGPPGAQEFEAGHVPGARFVDLETALAAPAHSVPGGGRHPLPDPSAFVEAMRTVGVSRGSSVVVYDAVGGTSAARCWWLLRHHGHGDVRLLDGGWPAWVAAGGETETGPTGPVAAGDFDGAPGAMPTLDADAAARLAAEPDGVLLDVRAGERFRGETEPVDPVAGHVPGAVNLPTTNHLENGAFGGVSLLERRRSAFAALGVDAGREVGVYCGSGVTASHTVLLLDALGVRAALYPGSWSGWTDDPQRPVATGP